MELNQQGKRQKLSFMLLHVVFLAGILECMLLATDPVGFCRNSGLPFLMEADPKGVEAVIIVWIIGTTLALVVSRKRMYVHHSVEDRYLWEEQVQKGSMVWFLLAVIPQLLVSLYVELYYYFFACGEAVAVLLFAVKVVCTLYIMWVLIQSKG